MNISGLHKMMINHLEAIFDVSEIESFFYMLIDYRFKFNKIEYVLNKDYLLSKDDIIFFDEVIARLKQEEPIQYIVGETVFYDLKFYVNSSTLIPRPETEELVDWVVKDNFSKKTVNILDIGTGSGCIPITLSKNIENSIVTSVDVSEKALQVAKKNAYINNVEVSFIKDTILEPTKINGSDNVFDVIISNPPYVRDLEKREIKKNVLSYEPHLALFVEDDDPLIFYRKISQYALNHLNEKGVLYFEINQYLAKETILLLKKIGFKNIELRKDLSGNDRMIKAFNF